LAQEVHNPTTSYLGYVLYCGLLMSVMRNYIRHNDDVTEAIFWVCCATIIGSVVWILLHI